MSVPKIFGILCVVLFGCIGIAAVLKKYDKPVTTPPQSQVQVVELDLLKKEQVVAKPEAVVEEAVIIDHDEGGLKELFAVGSTSPIIETVQYKSRVTWKPARQAWLIDYAHHYKTPINFIYRSLGVTDGGRSIVEGARFNVFRNDVDFRFHAVVSLSSCTMRLYYVLTKEKKAVFLKNYSVCLGRKDSTKASGSLTPLGTYVLGSRVGVFHPKMMGPYKGKKVELIQVFGAYWIPFEKEIDQCSEPAKGFGLHGSPLKTEGGRLVEDSSAIGSFASDGCIRLSGADMKEVFSLISTRPTYVEIVPSFQHSQLLQGQI